MIPKMIVPTYEVTLPSNGKKINIRPFLVKEEKILLMAIESNDNDEIIRSTIQTIQNCIITENIDVESLPFFDIDYLFIALRAKSIGENIDVKFHCNAMNSGTICGNDFKATIDISNCAIRKVEDLGTDVALGQGVVVKMRYPSYREMKKISNKENQEDLTHSLISICMDMIVQGESVHTRKDFETEIPEFLGGLTKQHYTKLAYWVDNLPTFYVKAEATCNKCGFDHKIEYNEFESFFV
jgi:hypothetical protein